MKKLFLGFLLSFPGLSFAANGTVTVIDKIAPKNGAFVGVVDASQTVTNVTTFNNNLSGADTDVQKALETIDNLSISGGGGSGGYAVEPATVTFRLNKGVTASTATFSTMTVTAQAIFQNVATTTFQNVSAMTFSTSTTLIIPSGQSLTHSSSVTVQGVITAGSNITLTPTAGVLTISAASGGGGGTSSLEVFNNFNGTRSSPTLSIGMSNAFGGSVSGSTYTFALNSSSVTMYGTSIPAASIASGSLGSSVLVSSLATVATPGTYGSTIVAPVITINAQGQVTSLSSATIATGAADMVLASTQTMSAPHNISNGTTSPAMTISQTGNAGIGYWDGSKGGSLVIDKNSIASTDGLVVISSQATQSSIDSLAHLISQTTSYNELMLWIQSNSTSTIGANADIRIDANNPDIELQETDQLVAGTGNGKWELAVNFDQFQINQRNAADNSFQTLLAVARNGSFRFKELDNGGDYVGFIATNTLSGSFVFQLPSDNPSEASSLHTHAFANGTYDMYWLQDIQNTNTLQSGTTFFTSAGRITTALGGGTTSFIVNQNDTSAQAVRIISTGTANALYVETDGDAGNGSGSSGNVFINNTFNPGIGLQIYSGNTAPTASNGLVLFKYANSGPTQPLLRLDNAGTGNSLKIVESGSKGTTLGSSGSIFVDNTQNTGIGVQIYSATSTATGALLHVMGSSTAWASPIAIFESTSTSSNAINLRLKDQNPDIEFQEIDQLTPAGKYKIDVSGDQMRILTRSSADNSYETAIKFTGPRNSFGASLQMQTTGQILFDDADDSRYIGLKASATVVNNVVFTLPAADGSSGQVMQTDGLANLSFVTPSAGSGSSIYNATSTAGFPFGFSASTEVISGTVATSTISIIKGTVSQTADLTEWQDSNGVILSSVAADGNITASTFTAKVGIQTPKIRFAANNFAFLQSFGGTGINLFANGNSNTTFKSTSVSGVDNVVGGRTSATYQPQGDFNMDGFAVNTTPTALLQRTQPWAAYSASINTDGLGLSQVYFGSRSVPGEDTFFAIAPGTNTNCGAGCFSNNPSTPIFVANTKLGSSNFGYIGVGIATPTFTLDVSGTMRISSVTKVNGGLYWGGIENVTANKTLTSTHTIVLASATISAATTITLPPATNLGQQITIKKVDASTQPVNIIGAGSDLIETTTTIRLYAQYQFQTLTADGSTHWLAMNGITYTPNYAGPPETVGTAVAIVAVASTAYATSFSLNNYCAMTGIRISVGVGASTNTVQAGIYDQNLTSIAISTAQALTSGRMNVNLTTPVQLIPGQYWLVMSVSDANTTLIRHGSQTGIGNFSKTSSKPLPTNLTGMSESSLGFIMEGLCAGGQTQ